MDDYNKFIDELLNLINIGVLDSLDAWNKCDGYLRCMLDYGLITKEGMINKVIETAKIL